MPPSAARTSRLDRIAIMLSGICIVHCLASAIVIGLLATAGGLLGSPVIHEVGLVLAMILGSVALIRGIREHGFLVPSAVGALGLGLMGLALTMDHGRDEVVVTIAGVLTLALGHQLNSIASA
jgi:hypothetical protein